MKIKLKELIKKIGWKKTCKVMDFTGVRDKDNLVDYDVILTTEEAEKYNLLI